MKKTISIVLMLVMVLSLSVASFAEESKEQTAPAPKAQTAAATPVRATDETANAQIEYLFNNFSTFKQAESADAKWFYAVTDLDHNGRLELLANTKSGSGAAKLKAWEVSPNGANLILSSMQTIPAPFDVDEEDLRVDFFILNMRSDSLDTYFDSQTGLFY